MPINDLYQGKFCVFCGNKPQQKNNEHIIPKWLIKQTGSLNRVIQFGFNYEKILNGDFDNLEKFKFDIKSFQFPACKKCNDWFGENLESPMSKLMEQIFLEQPIDQRDIILILNWFDKLRTGLWLAQIYLNKKNLDDFVFFFHIERSIGQNDRMLAVYRLDASIKGLKIIGASTPAFLFYPFSFAIRINQLLFLNMAYPFFLSRRMGFPYADNICMLYDNSSPEQFNFTSEVIDTSRGKYSGIITMKPGKERWMLPFIQKNFYKSTVLYQAVINKSIYHKYLHLYDNKYVTDNTFDYNSEVVSKIVFDNGKLENIKNKIIITPKTSEIQEDHIYDLISNTVLRFQNWVIDMAPSLDLLPKEESRKIKKERIVLKEYNKMLFRKQQEKHF